MNVRFAPEALEDLEAAVDFLLAEGAEEAARDLVERTIELASRLAQREFEGPEQTLPGGRVVRSWPLRPFRLYYRWRGADLEVVRVYHQRRDPLG